jgi:hypothetical protein
VVAAGTPDRAIAPEAYPPVKGFGKGDPVNGNIAPPRWRRVLPIRSTGSRYGMGETDTSLRVVQGYAENASDERPLKGYATVMAIYATAAATVAGIARLTGRRLPDRMPAGDLALLSVSTHKISRLLTKDAVTSPLRAPVTRFEGPAGEAEVNESPRGSGAQHALGELLTCPFCTAVWVAGGLAAGLVFAPRLTRFGMGVATAIAGADFLHVGYDAAKRVVNN